MNKSGWKTLIDIVITVLTAIAATLTTTSTCHIQPSSMRLNEKNAKTFGCSGKREYLCTRLSGPRWWNGRHEGLKIP